MGVRTHVLIKYSSDKMALDEAILRLNENSNSERLAAMLRAVPVKRGYGMSSGRSDIPAITLSRPSTDRQQQQHTRSLCSTSCACGRLTGDSKG